MLCYVVLNINNLRQTRATSSLYSIVWLHGVPVAQTPCLVFIMNLKTSPALFREESHKTKHRVFVFVVLKFSCRGFTSQRAITTPHLTQPTYLPTTPHWLSLSSGVLPTMRYLRHPSLDPAKPSPLPTFHSNSTIDWSKIDRALIVTDGSHHLIFAYIWQPSKN